MLPHQLRTGFIVLLLGILHLTLHAKGDWQLARIQDKDGYTNVRSGQGSEFSVVGKIHKDDFFYCEPFSGTVWVKVAVYRNEETIEGFVHSSRIQLIISLPLAEKKQLIMTVLRKQKALAEKSDKPGSNEEDQNKFQVHSFDRYMDILPVLSEYFCRSKDIEPVLLLFETSQYDDAAISETSSMILGDCFDCHPDLMAQELSKMPNKKKKDSILLEIESALLLKFCDGESLETCAGTKEQKARHQQLMKILKTARS